MATPTFITFSRFQGNLLEAVDLVQTHVCPPWRCQLDRAAFLRSSDDPYDGGMTIDGELAPCTTLDAVAELARTGKPLGLSYISYPTRANFYLEFFDIAKDAYSLAVSFESSILYHKNEEYGQSQWFEGWLVSLVTALRPGVCVYGNTELIDPNAPLSQGLAALRRVRYKAIDPGEVLDRLRAGDLLELPSPVWHAIRTDLMKRAELVSLMKKRPCAPRLTLALAPEHHILSNLI